MSDDNCARVAAVAAIGRISDAHDIAVVTAALVEAIGDLHITGVRDVRRELRTALRRPSPDGSWILAEALTLWAQASRFNG